MDDYNLNTEKEIKKLLLALEITDSGFLCYTTPTAYGQQDIAKTIMSRITTRKTHIFDCSLIKTFSGFSFINDLVYSNQNIELFVIYNLQRLYTLDDKIEFFRALNLSRDPWANLKKLFLLGATENFMVQVMLNAPDYYSFFLSTFNLRIQPKEIFMTLNDIAPYQKNLSLQTDLNEIIKNRFNRLLNDVTYNNSSNYEYTQTLYLSFVDAWIQYKSVFQDAKYDMVDIVLNELVKFKKKWTPSLSTANNLLIIGTAFLSADNYNEALNYFNKILLLSKKYSFGKNIDMNKLYSNIIKCYSGMGRFDFIGEI